MARASDRRRRPGGRRLCSRRAGREHRQDCLCHGKAARPRACPGWGQSVPGAMLTSTPGRRRRPEGPRQLSTPGHLGRSPPACRLQIRIMLILGLLPSSAVIFSRAPQFLASRVSQTPCLQPVVLFMRTRREFDFLSFAVLAYAEPLPARRDGITGDRTGSDWRQVDTHYSHTPERGCAQHHLGFGRLGPSGGHRGGHELQAVGPADEFHRYAGADLVQRQRVQQGGHERPAAQGRLQVGAENHRGGGDAGPLDRRCGGLGHEGLGDREGRHALRARFLSSDRDDCREARQLPVARRQRRRDRRVQRRAVDSGRARRIELPDRRHPPDLRSARLHDLGRYQPGLHPGEPQWHDLMYPDGVRFLDRRGA